MKPREISAALGIILRSVFRLPAGEPGGTDCHPDTTSVATLKSGSLKASPEKMKRSCNEALRFVAVSLHATKVKRNGPAAIEKA